MVRTLLVRGLWVGLVAGLLVLGFAYLFGEPSIDRAIDFEEQAAHAAGEHHGAELVSRSVQPWRIVAGVEFRSVTVLAHKGEGFTLSMTNTDCCGGGTCS